MDERIREIRKHFGLSQAAFGEKIGMSRDSVASLECGRVEPSTVVSKAIMRAFGINYDWLTTGDGAMFENKESEILTAIEDLLEGKNARAAAMLRAMAKFTDKQWAALDEMLDIIEKELGR